MNEEMQSAEDYFTPELSMEEEEREEVIIDAEVIPEFEGVCPKCFGSKYLMTKRNGIMGVLYTSESNDSEGKPIKRLMACDCTVKASY